MAMKNKLGSIWNQSTGTAFELKNMIASIAFDVSSNDNMKGGQSKNGELSEKFPMPGAMISTKNISTNVPRRSPIDYWW